MRVLILSASAGNGHLSAARALEQRFRELGAHVRTADALDCGPRLFRLWFCGGYETLVRRVPGLWGFLYRWADRPGPAYWLQTMMDDRLLFGLERLIASERPDWIVCTHSLPQPRLARLRSAYPELGLAVVVTDIYPHRMWLRGDPDRYFVPVERTREVLEARRPGSARITEVTGIPIAPAFVEAPGRETARDQLGMAGDDRAALRSSGGIGGGPLAAALAALASAKGLSALTVVCGRNAQAADRCRLAAARLPEHERRRIRVVGRLPQDEFALHLAAADLVVGKPGGLTMSECMAVGRAMVVYSPLTIPGQEEGNAEYLCANGIGVSASDPDSLRAVVSDLLAAPDRLARMEVSAREAARPHAALTIARRIMDAGAAPGD
ncbi:MAG: hypothetical protein FJX72_12145 [Armatimonadetes bacterium]|nr:hypothetical protein [Armatimonadota bacterium]